MQRLAMAAVILASLALPLSLFAQTQGASGTAQPGTQAEAAQSGAAGAPGAAVGPLAQERRALAQLGLTDAQVTQVLDIQTRTRDTLRQGAAQERVLQAQIEKAMLATPVNLQTVNGLVDQAAQARASMRKTALAARAQLQQVMGIDNYQRYMRGVRRALAHRFPGMARWRAMHGRMLDGVRDGPMGEGWVGGGWM